MTSERGRADVSVAMAKCQQWYPLPLFTLLFCFVITRSMTDFPPSSLSVDKACSECTTQCPQNFIQRVSAAGGANCLTCACLDQDSEAKLTRFRKQYKKNIPLLFSTPRLLRLGKPATFSCNRWYDESNSTQLLSNRLNYTNAPHVIDVNQLRSYHATVTPADGSDIFRVTVVKLTIVTDRSTTENTLSCTTEDPSQNDSKSLFAYSQSQPVIKGPNKVPAGNRVTWSCRVDFVTIHQDVDKEVDMAIELVPAGALHYNRSALTHNQTTKVNNKGMSLYQELQVQIPVWWEDSRFEIGCTSIHRLVSNIVRSAPFFVVVPASGKVKDLDPVFTLLGGVMGFCGSMIVITFLVYYMLNRHCEKQGQHKVEQVMHWKAMEDANNPHTPLQAPPLDAQEEAVPIKEDPAKEDAPPATALTGSPEAEAEAEAGGAVAVDDKLKTSSAL